MRDRETAIAAIGVVGIGCALLVGLHTAPAAAYTPESPVVSQMVEQGVRYLEAVHAGKAEKFYEKHPEGARLLMAYTHHKVRADVNHPIVQEGLGMAVGLARRAESGGLPNTSKITYETSVAILLMIDANPQEYAREIQGLANALVAVQKPHGGFGYLSEQEGDTSQTQYVVLAMWTLDRADFEVPRAAMDRALQWLLRTQDPSGRWGYKGKDSGAVGKLIPQDSMQGHSLTTAGAGSVLIGGDFFGLWGGRSKQLKSDVTGLPAALKEQVNQEEVRKRRSSFPIPAGGLMQFVGRSENWLTANPYQRRMPWFYYYVYTLERYKSFLEIAQGKQEQEPEWYNHMVEVLRSSQAPEGGWGIGADHSPDTSPAISTCFSILFLIRSTKKAIGDMNEGILAGGYDLPKDTTNIRVEGTQIKGPAVAEAVTDLLSLLEDEDADSLETGSIPENLKLADDPVERKQQLSRLERLARGSRSYQARRVATRLLGQSDDLAMVPALIYGLSDPDRLVRRYARDGLRFISRRFEGFGLSDQLTPQEIRGAVKAWRQWYTEIDPGYVFLD